MCAIRDVSTWRMVPLGVLVVSEGTVAFWRLWWVDRAVFVLSYP